MKWGDQDRGTQLRLEIGIDRDEAFEISGHLGKSGVDAIPARVKKTGAASGSTSGDRGRLR
jgi:hypothetical protein